MTVDRVVALSPHTLVLTDGELVALDPVTGRPQWSHPAATAGADEVGAEVAVVDAAGIAILDADTGTVRDRLEMELAEAVVAESGQRTLTGPGETLGVELHDQVVGVATMSPDQATMPGDDRWALALYDRTDGREVARHPRASRWWRNDDLLIVLAASDDDVTLHAVSTTAAAPTWSRPLGTAATSDISLGQEPTGELLVSLAAAQDQAEVVSLHPATGQQLARYGGAGWGAVGDGLLAAGASVPVAGTTQVTTLAGPEGSVTFSRPVALVSTEPLIVSYWGVLIRVDDGLLT